MRTTRLMAALAMAAATVIALAPVASASRPQLKHPHDAHAAGGCIVSLIAEPYVVTSGEAAQLFGRLRCLDGSTSTQTVTVYERAAGAGEFTALGTASTGPGGFYSIVAPKLTADTTFYASAAGARSLDKVVRVAPVLTFAGPGETAVHGPEGAALLTGVHHRATFTGTVSPADAGAVVVLQRENATTAGFSFFEEWEPIQAATVGPNGSYSITHIFVLPGAANLRVLVRPRGRLDVRGISNALSYEISQPQNTAVTLDASVNPVADGQDVKLTGKVAGASDAPVTLTAHTDGNDPFAAIATSTTNAAGEFTFTESPTTSTYYQAQSGSAQSTVQFEGVSYLLTAAVSAETVHSGEAVTFSGTVSPIHAGHPVYVERQNAGPRGGFHVVDVGAVSPTGTYSIADYLFGFGTGVYRVAIPADFANAASVSRTFSINVTAPMPSLSEPAPQATLPKEGKV